MTEVVACIEALNKLGALRGNQDERIKQAMALREKKHTSGETTVSRASLSHCAEEEAETERQPQCLVLDGTSDDVAQYSLLKNAQPPPQPPAMPMSSNVPSPSSSGVRLALGVAIISTKGRAQQVR